MIDYTGIKCPVCEVPFKKGDDIVVCPTCGAPYHRHCYQETGHCVFEEELHSTGKAWEAPQSPNPPDLKSEIKDQECPVCGTLNAHSALFCNRCGSSLSGAPPQYQNKPNNTENNSELPIPPSPFGSYGTAFNPMPMDPMGGVSPTEQLDDDVSFGSVSKLVKQNTAYYMPVFRYIKTTKKNKFNFCAFLCAGPWMLYRKQYKFGTIVTVLLFTLYLASNLLSIFVSQPLYLEMLTKIGVDINSNTAVTMAEMQELTKLLMENPMDYLKFASSTLCLLGMLIIMIIVGIRGNKMYMKHCIRTIKEIQDEHSSSDAKTDINTEIESRAGVNVAIGVCMFVCYLIMSNLMLFM